MTRATTHQMGVDAGSPMMWTGRIHQDRQHGQTRQPCGHHTVMSSLDDEIAVVRPAAAAAAGSPAASRRVDTGWPEELVLGPAPPDSSAPSRLQPFSRPLSRKPPHRDGLCTCSRRAMALPYVCVAAATSTSIPRPCIRETSTFRPCHTRPSSSAAGRPDRT